jgi:hypothetical protein
MRAARIAVLLAAACRPSTPPAPPAPAAPDAQAVSCIDRWLAQRDLNQYGDPVGTVYAGGTPLFDERTGRTTDRIQHLVGKHPELRQACPEEVLKAHAP